MHKVLAEKMPTCYFYIDDKVSVSNGNILPVSLSYNSVYPKFHSLLARFTLSGPVKYLTISFPNVLVTVKFSSFFILQRSHFAPSYR